tara:strand:+ start:483 stop:1025 length:543 start_codon:yes stop_codon:yes gene_type:complete
MTTKFLKLIIEPIYGPVGDKTVFVKFDTKGSNGSGEYLFNLSAISAPNTTTSIDRAAAEYCSNLNFIIGDQQAYEGIEFLWAKPEAEELDATPELINLGNYQDALDSINGGEDFGDIKTVEQLNEAMCSAQRIWESFINPKEGNTKLGSILSSRDFKGKVYNKDGDLVELVGWRWVECDA